MKGILSVLAGVGLFASSLGAQAIPKPLVSEVHHADANMAAPTFAGARADSVKASESHAVRNGMVAGAVIGGTAVAALAIYYRDSFGGCDESLVLPGPGASPRPCHAERDRYAVIAMLTGTGIGLGGVAGAILGGVWQVAEKF